MGGWVRGRGPRMAPLAPARQNKLQLRQAEAAPSVPLASGWQHKYQSVGLSPFKAASGAAGWALGCLLNPALAAFLIFPALKASGINLQDGRRTQLLITTTEPPSPPSTPLHADAVFDSGPIGFPL